METRTLAAIVVAGLNDLAEKIEEEMSADKDGDGKEDDKGKEKEGRSRSRTRDKDKDERPARSSKKDEDEDDDDPEDDKDKDGKDKDSDDDDEPSEKEIAKVTRAALKVLDQDDVVALIKKHGKAERATLVKPALRQKVIDALEEAIEEADKD